MHEGSSNVMTSTRALPNVITSMMHVTTFGRALAHVISCMMHVITFGRARACYILHHACYNIR